MSPARRTGPEVAPAGADNTHLTGEVDLAMRVMIALALGLILGAEREFRGHPAGLRTIALISAGSCMFTGLGLIPQFASPVDATRVAAVTENKVAIVTGVGFLGAGSILRQGEEVKGLTTAASIWVAASIGMAVGFAYYGVAIFTTLVVVVVLVALKPMEDRVFPLRRNRRRDDPKPNRPAE